MRRADELQAVAAVGLQDFAREDDVSGVTHEDGVDRVAGVLQFSPPGAFEPSHDTVQELGGRVGRLGVLPGSIVNAQQAGNPSGIQF